jgi:hypothetical protein
MCEHCHEATRREVLKGAALGLAAAALAACGEPPPLNDLPNAYEEHVPDESGARVKIDESKIVIPPPQPPQVSDYGSIMPRSAWTTSPLELRNATLMGGVTKLTIHHSGDGKPFTPATAADVARHLQIVLQAHLQRGMIDIGYHFAVDPQGRVWQLRSLKYEGQHVRMSANGFHNNEHNIGVVALGDFNLQAVSTAQRDRLLELVRQIRAKYVLKPAAVFMHGEIVQTDCPGKNLKPVIVDARRRNLV